MYKLTYANLGRKTVTTDAGLLLNNNNNSVTMTRQISL